MVIGLTKNIEVVKKPIHLVHFLKTLLDIKKAVWSNGGDSELSSDSTTERLYFTALPSTQVSV